MTDAIRYEWARLRTLRSTWWITGLAVFVGIGIALVMALAFRSSLSDAGPSSDDRKFLPTLFASQGASVFVPFLFAFLIAMLGVFAWGHEYRHGMIRSTLTAVADRRAVWVAKFLVVGAWVSAFWVISSAASIGIGALVLAGSGIEVAGPEAWKMLLRCLVYVLVLTWLAMGFTALVRQQVVALVLLFLWPFVVENVLSGLITAIGPLHDAVGFVTRFLPFDAGAQVVNVADFGIGEHLSPWLGGLVFAGYAVVLMIASYVLFRRRDA